MRGLAALFTALTTLALAGAAWGHAMPNSLLLAHVRENAVVLDATLPWMELKYVLPPSLAQPPLSLSSAQSEELATYLKAHLSVLGPGGEAWPLKVETVGIARSPDHADLQARLTFTRPAGARAGPLVLCDSAIMHIVMSHTALVFVDGQGRAPRLAGVLQNPRFDVTIAAPSSVRGFASAWMLGMRHIAEGADHLLFLLTLMLPAPLMARAGRWGQPRPAREALLALAATVTAFTVGHSISLIAGAGLNLAPPEKPVEVAIAASILVAAVAAWRPLPGEPRSAVLLAGGFGLVHGLAFSAVLSELDLAPWPKAQAVAGFNLGIETVQMLIVLVVAPLLIGLARTRFYPWARSGGAALAAAAALYWLWTRLSAG